MKYKKNFYYFTSILFIFSCTNISYQPDVVSKSDLKKQHEVFGSIIQITKVTIEGDRDESAGGQSANDSEPESDIAIIIGGLISSPVGAEVGSKISKKDRVELLIKTDIGRLVSIIQEVSKYNFKINQKVQIIKRNGKSRVLPFD